MSEDEPKKKTKTRATRRSKVLPGKADPRVLAEGVGPTITPPRMTRARMPHSSKTLVSAISEKLIAKDEKGRYVLADREGTERALHTLGDKTWAAARMVELDDALSDLNSMDPTSIVFFVV